MKKNYRYYVQRYTYTRTKKLGWCIYCKSNLIDEDIKTLVNNNKDFRLLDRATNEYLNFIK